MRNLLTTALVIALWGAPAHAAQIQITGQSHTQVKEGDDFFADEMNNPIDFAERRDFMWEENFSESTITASGGVWSGQCSSQGGYVFPLFAGFDGALNTGLVGANYALDSSKYTYLSFLSACSDYGFWRLVYWTRDIGWPDGTYGVAANNAYLTDQWVHYADSSWVVNNHDLSGNTDWTSGNVRAVRLDISPQAAVGSTMQFSWVRIVDPDSGPDLTLYWNASGYSGNPKVNVYLDNDASGYNGAFLARSDNVGYYTFPSAILPPGVYYFYLTLCSNIGSDSVLATSGYSSPLVVNGKTRIEFQNPSATSGEDYATSVVGNPWDMSDWEDVANESLPMNQKNFEQGYLGQDGDGDTYFAAKAILPADATGQSESDSQIWLNVNPSNPIDTSKFRYLSYKMGIDGTLYGNISDKVEYGWISRIVWWNTGIDTDGSETKGNVVYEGSRTYWVNLAASGTLETTNAFPANTGWQGNSTISSIRLDTTEAAGDGRSPWFYVYDVKLTANPEPMNDSFTVQFTTTDPDDDAASLSFYLDTGVNMNGTLVGSSTFAAGTNTFSFNTSSFHRGDYYLYAVVTDAAGNVEVRYAEVPIKVSHGCDDGLACTTGDARTEGVCEGTPVVCAALSQCHQAGMCDPATGLCSNPTAADGKLCNDGDQTTVVDQCHQGSCVGSFAQLLESSCDDPLPGKILKSIRRKEQRQQEFLRKADNAAARSDQKKVEKFRQRATSQLQAITRKASKSARLSDNCRDAIEELIQERKDAIKGFPFGR